MLYLLPGLLTYTVFILFPVIQTVILGSMEWNGMGAKKFVGLQNYLEPSPTLYFSVLVKHAVLVLFIMVLPTLLVFFCNHNRVEQLYLSQVV
jgi:ABC-type sugar transport system permease subunit